MTRPTIKGSPIHKASIAKATARPVVSQSRTTADGSLVQAASELGKSNIPGAIDYKVAKPYNIVFPEDANKTKKYGDGSGRHGSDGVDEGGRNQSTNPEEEGYYEEDSDDQVLIDIIEGVESDYPNIVRPEKEEVVEEFAPSVFGEDDSDPFTYRTTESGGYQYLDTRDGDDAEWEDATRPSAIEAISKKDPAKDESAIQQRDSRIYRNAISGGSVRKKLTKNGYNPYK